MDFSVDRVESPTGVVWAARILLVIESWNFQSWKGFTRTIKPNSWPWSQWPGMGSKGPFLDCTTEKEGECSFTPCVGRERVGQALRKTILYQIESDPHQVHVQGNFFLSLDGDLILVRNMFWISNYLIDWFGGGRSMNWHLGMWWFLACPHHSISNFKGHVAAFVSSLISE